MRVNILLDKEEIKREREREEKKGELYSLWEDLDACIIYKIYNKIWNKLLDKKFVLITDFRRFYNQKYLIWTFLTTSILLIRRTSHYISWKYYIKYILFYTIVICLFVLVRLYVCIFLIYVSLFALIVFYLFIFVFNILNLELICGK